MYSTNLKSFIIVAGLLERRHHTCRRRASLWVNSSCSCDTWVDAPIVPVCPCGNSIFSSKLGTEMKEITLHINAISFL